MKFLSASGFSVISRIVNLASNHVIRRQGSSPQANILCSLVGNNDNLSGGESKSKEQWDRTWNKEGER